MNDDLDDDLTGPVLDPADDAAVTLLLAGLPEVTIPADVADRIATALAAEVPLSGTVPAWAAGGATNLSVLPSQRERDQRKSARRGRVLSAAAAVVLVLGAVAFGTQLFNGGDGGGNDTAGSGAPAERSADGAQTNEATLLTSSNTAYDKADIAPKVTGLVTAASLSQAPTTVLPDTVPPAATPPPVPAPSLDVRDFTRAPFAALAVCVAKLRATGAEHPVAVDTGTWPSDTGSASPVAVIVLPALNPAQVDAFVVTAACGDPAVVDDSYLLYYRSVPRP